jgi:hypothetical protein
VITDPTSGRADTIGARADTVTVSPAAASCTTKSISIVWPSVRTTCSLLWLLKPGADATTVYVPGGNAATT